MTRARNSANLASDGNLFVDISNDRTGIGSVAPAQNLHVAGTAGFHADTTFVGDLYNTTWDRSANSLKFVDNARIRIGSNDDFQIYHDGSFSRILNTSGDILIKNSASGRYLYLQSAIVMMQPPGGGDVIFDGRADGPVKLYHDGSQKFQTTAYGTDTTGTAVNDGLVVAGVATVTTMNVTGVLTYDDVTSIDSIGIITARSNIDCNGNLDVAGTVGSGNITVTSTSPTINFADTNNDPDFRIQRSGTGLAIQDTTNSNATRFLVKANGDIDITGNLDAQGGVDVTGNITVTGTVDGVDIAALSTTVSNITTDVVSDTSPQLGGDLDANSKNIFFGDSSSSSNNRIQFGTTDKDLQIYHDGSHSRVAEGGTGNLILSTNGGTVSLYNTSNSEDLAKFIGNGAVELYYNGEKTLSTFVNALHLFGNAHECNIDLKLSNGNRCGFLGFTNSGRVQINGAANGNAYETYLEGNLNGSTKLFYDNSVRIETLTEGAKIKRHSGGATTLYIEGAEGSTAILDMFADDGDDNADKFRLQASTDGTFSMQNYAAGSWETNIRTVGNAQVDLYWNNVRKFNTEEVGANFYGRSVDCQLRFKTSDGTNRGHIYAYNDNSIAFLNAAGNYSFRANNDKTVTFFNHGLPNANNSYDLGSSSANWRRLYTGGITVSDNGVSGEILTIRADDQSPWLFNLGNDTYHSNNGGLWGYQANNGDFYLRYRGNSEYKSFYIQRWDGSTSNLVAHFDYYGRFGGYFQNTLALQTAVDGIDVFAGADNQNGEIRIRPRGTAVYATLSFYSAAGASVGSVGTHSGASTIYYIAANSGSHLFHFGGAYKLHLTSSTVKPHTGVTLDLGSSGDPFNDLFIKNGTCSGTGSFKVPAGTTAQRPTGANGQLRYNSTLNILEGYINGAWTKVKGTGLAESGSYANNTQAIADDLYAYWSCDSTSTTRDGGDSGSATLYGVSSSGGKIGNSWDRGTAAANGMNLTSMPTGNNWTLMFWLYLSSNTIHSTSDGAGIIWLDSTQAGSVILGYDGSNGNNLRFGGNGWVSDGEVVFSSFGTTGVWRHMVITNNSNSWKFYLDGSLITTRSESLNNNGNWWLANYSRHGGNTNNHYFRGRLDEIAIWHRTLTAGEISETYNAQNSSATQLVP